MSSSPTTGQFRVEAAVYVKTAARRRLWSVVWLPALLLAAAAVAGCFDSRFWFLGLLLLLIIYPMALSLTWLAYVARPEMRWLLRPQELTIDPDGATVGFYGYDEDAPLESSLHLAQGDIREGESTGKYTAIFLTENSFGINFLLVPTEKLPAEVNFYELIKE